MRDEPDQTINPRCQTGPSGWVYPHWYGVFYPPDLPQSRWYDYYRRHFSTVEINNSFYRLPAETTFDHWQTQAPADFIYTIKANRFLTHVLKDGLFSLTSTMTLWVTRLKMPGC